MAWRRTPSHNVLVLSIRQQPCPARGCQCRLDITRLVSCPLPVLLSYRSLFCTSSRHRIMSMSSSDEKRGVVPPPHTTQQEAWRTIRAARLRFLVFAIAVVVLLANYGHRVVLTVNIDSLASTAECEASKASEATEWSTEDWDKVCRSIREPVSMSLCPSRCQRRVWLLLPMSSQAGVSLLGLEQKARNLQIQSQGRFWKSLGKSAVRIPSRLVS